jgi:L-ascorbate metabolism protein UlaG (beta-lactamase superfamily)
MARLTGRLGRRSGNPMFRAKRSLGSSRPPLRRAEFPGDLGRILACCPEGRGPYGWLVRITKFRHSCLFVEDGDACVLLDPGSFSPGFEELSGLTGVLVTHQHPDHVDIDRLRATVSKNSEARVFTDEATAGKLADAGIEAAAVHEGDTLDVGVEVRVFGRDHAMIHPDIPVVPNVCFFIAGRLFHPGDSFTVPSAEVGILALPTSAPWLKLAESVDYLRTVAPRIAVPIHEAHLVSPDLYYGRFKDLAPAGTDVRIVDDAGPVTV